VVEQQPRLARREVRRRGVEPVERANRQRFGQEVGALDRREAFVFVDRVAVEFGHDVREPQPLVPGETVGNRERNHFPDVVERAVGGVGQSVAVGEPLAPVGRPGDREAAGVRAQLREDPRAVLGRIEGLVVRHPPGVGLATYSCGFPAPVSTNAWRSSQSCQWKFVVNWSNAE